MKAFTLFQRILPALLFALIFTTSHAQAQLPDKDSIFSEANKKIGEVSQDLGLGEEPDADAIKKEATELIQKTGEKLGLFPKEEENAMPDIKDPKEIFEEVMNDQTSEGPSGPTSPTTSVAGPFSEANMPDETTATSVSEPRGEYPFFDFSLVDPSKTLKVSNAAVQNALNTVVDNNALDQIDFANISAQSNAALNQSLGSLGFNNKNTQSTANTTANTNTQSSIAVPTATTTNQNFVTSNINLDAATGAAGTALKQTDFIFNRQ